MAKKQKLCHLLADVKDLCFFAVSRGRQKAPAKKATVNSFFAVCFLAADGKGLCRPPYDVIYTSLDARFFAACHCRQTAGSLPSATDGKVFAVCHCRQTDQMGQLPGSTARCHVSSLLSAADGKEPVAVGGRRQRACILSLLSVFY